MMMPDSSLGGLDDQGRRDLADEARRHDEALRRLAALGAADPAHRRECDRHYDRLAEIARTSAERMQGGRG